MERLTWIYFRKRHLTSIRHHRQSCDRLLLHVPPHQRRVTRGVEQLQKPLDDGVEVRKKRISLDAFAEIDQGCGSVGVDSVREK